MTEVKIETHIQRFSEVLDRVLDHRGSLQNSGGIETNLAAIAIVQDELLQLRAELALPSREYLGHKMIEHDYQALIRLVDRDLVSARLTQKIEVNEYGRVTNISISQRGGDYGNLSDIELLTELRHLTAYDVQVADCSALSKLTYLKSFITVANMTLNVETFGAMIALEKFVGDHSRIGALSWVSRCPNIKYLSVESCNIDSIEEIASCERLELLDISRNPIQSLAPLEGHLLIQKLFIQDTDITDFSPLISMPSLYELKVSAEMAKLRSFQEYRRNVASKGVEVTIENEDFSLDYI